MFKLNKIVVAREKLIIYPDTEYHVSQPFVGILYHITRK